MITPRLTRLVRAPDLRAMQRAIAETCFDGDPLSPRSCAIIIPTRSAAEALRSTLEHLRLWTGHARALVLPDLVSRDEFYVRLHQRCPDAPPLLSDIEREVVLRKAARAAEAGGVPIPFAFRPGLVPHILAFYDALRRQGRTVADFDRLVTGSLEPVADVDRGAERMLRQTRFLAAVFVEFERLVARSECLDEHGLRNLLLSRPSASYRRVIVTVADQGADPRGLWKADYDLLARIPGLAFLDVFATENILASGFHERVHDLLPGIEEHGAGAASEAPVLVAPRCVEPTGTAPIPWFVSRDREEEVADFVRVVKPAAALDRIALVYQRPLPYLYLAHQVFADAQIPFQALDALPLAAEPVAAALDLVFAFIISEGSRAALIDLLGSPQWNFGLQHRDVAAADVLLRQVKYNGGWERLASLSAESNDSSALSGPRGMRWRMAGAVLRQAATVAEQLRAPVGSQSASGQVSALITFIKSHEKLARAEDPWFDRHVRARAAVLSVLESLAQAHARYDDEPLTIVELANTVRRWIQEQTFSPRTGVQGVLLLDAPAAAYANVNELRLVGLVEADWPEISRRSIFYPNSLLLQLGWPSEAERLSAARARFLDLLRLPRARVSASTFTLEQDSIVSPSPFLEELEVSGLEIERVPELPRPRVFLHEALSQDPIAIEALSGPAAEWAALRTSRTSADDPTFHGQTGARERTAYAVSHVERYLECPFKYFAAHVLRLDEERDDESGLTPQERGQLLHEAFEEFFLRWHASGGRAITIDNVSQAIDLFRDVAEEKLADLPEPDRALERTHLLGSAVAPGLATRAFNFEIEQGSAVIERLLEYPLEGQFTFLAEDRIRQLQIRAKADRIDLLADGTLRIVDYKLSRAPKTARALQLPIYGVCAAQHLDGQYGRQWTVGNAGYVAFREKNAFVSLGASTSLEQALADGQRRLIDAVDAIERGAFPPDPDEPFLCTRCGYASVCRKDYVGDDA